MKRTVSALIISVLLMVGVPFPSFGDTAYGHGYFEYYIVDGGIEICNYLGEEETVEVPNNISGLPVSGIVGRAFVDCPTVKALILPDTIMYIDEGAISPSIEVQYLGKQYGNATSAEGTTEAPSGESTTSVEDSYGGDSSVVSDGVTSIEEASGDESIGYEEVEEVLDEVGKAEAYDVADSDNSNGEAESSSGDTESNKSVQSKTKIGFVLGGLSVLLCMVLVLVKKKRDDK